MCARARTATCLLLFDFIVFICFSGFGEGNKIRGTNARASDCRSRRYSETFVYAEAVMIYGGIIRAQLPFQ